MGGNSNFIMSTWKDFPKILFLLEQANECLGRGHDIQECRDFLNAYLLDISSEKAETEAPCELKAAERLLGTLTHEALLALATGVGDMRDDLLKKCRVLENVDKVLHVYHQLKMIENNQYAPVLP